MRRPGSFAISILLLVSSRARADELPRVEPSVVGLSANGLSGIQPGLEKLVNDHKIAGAVVMVARHGKVAYVTTVGSRDLAKKTPMAEDTIFAIASMSKPITCMAAMILVEQGKLS